MLCSSVKGTQVCEHAEGQVSTPAKGISAGLGLQMIIRSASLVDCSIILPARITAVTAGTGLFPGGAGILSKWTRIPAQRSAKRLSCILRSRDWCRWNAAFYNNDLAQCEQIGWGTMRAKCSAGESPEDYFSLPSFKP